MSGAKSDVVCSEEHTLPPYNYARDFALLRLKKSQTTYTFPDSTTTNTLSNKFD